MVGYLLIKRCKQITEEDISQVRRILNDANLDDFCELSVAKKMNLAEAGILDKSAAGIKVEIIEETYSGHIAKVLLEKYSPNCLPIE